MKPGDKVMIYEDPITQEKPEGKAELVEKIGRNYPVGVEYWRVRFLEDEDDTDLYRRVIRV